MLAAFMQRPGPIVRRSYRRFVDCKLIRCNRGATIVEFALVVAPFLALLIALFQTVLVFFASRVLDETTIQASRYIFTGQAQQSNMTQAQFANYVCKNTFALFVCGNFMINVQSYNSFSAASTTTPNVDVQRERSSDQSMDLCAWQSGRHRRCPSDVSMAGGPWAARIQFVEPCQWQSTVGLDCRI